MLFVLILILDSLSERFASLFPIIIISLRMLLKVQQLQRGMPDLHHYLVNYVEDIVVILA